MSKFQDLSGQKFGKLTVLERAEDHIAPDGRKVIRYLCQCECGNTTIAVPSNLKNGHTTSCGCTKRESLIDITGQKFGRLTVIKRVEDYRAPGGRVMTQWLCQCECGNTITVTGNSLKKGHTKSCGCYAKSLINDLTGQKFGRLTVLEKAEHYVSPNGNYMSRWKCQCECGNIVIANASSLKNGTTTSCGCARFQDLTGMKFGRLTVIKRAYEYEKENGYNHPFWECQCECGNVTIVQTRSLKDGTTKSCGCYNKDIITKHGLSYNPLYKIYNHMIDRCYNPNEIHYDRYGGRGIAVCDEWLEKEDYNGLKNFVEWAEANGYEPGLTIDRIDNNGNYCPENCRWVDMKMQSNNRSSNHYVEYNDNSFTISQLATVLGVNYTYLYTELNRTNFDVNATISNIKSSNVLTNAVYFLDEYGNPIIE